MNTVTFDRLAGILIAAAAADALGAGYEFGGPIPATTPLTMRGQGAFEPGEWTDDTAQFLAIALAAANGADLSTPEGEDAVAAYLQDWYLSPARLKDIGIHSSQVFGAVATLPTEGLAQKFRQAAQEKEQANPHRSGGNGALMRTGAVAMALHHDPQRMVQAAMRLAGMTHDDQCSSESCAVWCLAIRRGLQGDPVWNAERIETLTTELREDIVTYLGNEAGAYWSEALQHAETHRPEDYYSHRPPNGYSVTALQAAWSAVVTTAIPTVEPAAHLHNAVEAAVRGGGDTDTVACIAGALLGAMWGYSAVPLQWRRRMFGWPGYGDADLLRVADRIHRRNDGTTVNESSWPHADHVAYDPAINHGTDSLAIHPHDAGVILAGVDAAYGTIPLPQNVDAVVSLCRVGQTDLDHLNLEPDDHIEVRLIDTTSQHDNPHLARVMNDAADAVHAFRSEGKRVLLHCVAAQSRTPSIAALYSVRHLGIDPDTALTEVCAALPAAAPNPAFRTIVRGE